MARRPQSGRGVRSDSQKQALKTESEAQKTLAVTEDPGMEPELIGKTADILRPKLRTPGEALEVATRVVATAEMFSGPMPHPQHLKAYEDISPGAAKSILDMAISEQNHRHKMQNLEMFFPYLGLITGFIGLLAMITGTVYIAVQGGSEKIALALIGANALGAIGLFIKARNAFERPPDNKLSGVEQRNPPVKRR